MAENAAEAGESSGFCRSERRPPFAPGVSSATSGFTGISMIIGRSVKAVLRRLVLPDWDALEARFRGSDQPTSQLLRELVAVIYDRLVGNPRAHQLVRLLVAEGPRLPELTEFYHAEVIERGMGLLRALLARGVERGDIRPSPVADYPQTVMAPALMAVLWSLLFAERHPLDLTRFFAAHLDLVLYGLAPR